MLHARKDYMHIQDETNKINKDEPVFLLRAKDELAPKVIRYWTSLLFDKVGNTPAYLATIKQADLMEKWQKENGSKTPDTPKNEIH